MRATIKMYNNWRAASLGSVLNFALSTRVPGSLFCASDSAKFIRASSADEFTHSVLTLE